MIRYGAASSAEEGCRDQEAVWEAVCIQRLMILCLEAGAVRDKVLEEMHRLERGTIPLDLVMGHRGVVEEDLRIPLEGLVQTISCETDWSRGREAGTFVLLG